MAKDNEKASARIKNASRVGLFQRLAARFGYTVGTHKDEKEPSYKIIQKPTPQQLLDKGTKDELDLISKLTAQSKMSSSIQDLFDEWMNDTQNTYANIQERQTRLDALTHMCDNEGLVKSAVTLVASEVAALTDTKAFTVISENQEWQNETNKLLSDVWHYTASVIYSLAWDIFLYGEAFQGDEVSSAGIVDVNTLKPNEIVERLEFKPAEVANFMAEMSGGNGQSSGFSVNLMRPTNGSFANTNLNFNWGSTRQVYRSKDSLLKDYLDNISDTSSNEFFTSHLLGYRIANDQMIAPWQVSHFRFNEHVSEFWPYGQPPLLACLAAYKQLQRAMGLDDLKQLLSYPITMYKVKTNNATTARAFDIVNTVKERFENVGLMSSSAGMEGPSLCTNIWTSDDLVSVEKTGGENAEASGNTDKLKFFQQRVSAATGIPLSYLDPTSENFQMSGVALAALYRPFRTLVEQIRSIIIEVVEDKIRLHDSIRNVETPEFVLNLNVENPIAVDDLSAKIQLADSILEAVAGMLGLEDKAQMPTTIKKDILSKYGGLSSKELDNYVKIMDQEGIEETVEGVSQEEADADFGDFDDEGGGDEGGDEGDMEEAFIQRKKNRLIETRYRNTHPEDVRYLLTEKLGFLKTSKCYSHFSKCYNNKRNEEAGEFLRSKKLSKQRLNG